jgi:hypothetical protein
MSVFTVWRQALRHYNHYGYRYIWLNVAWLVCSLPIVTAPAAWETFVHVSHRLYLGEVVGLNEFWEYIRQRHVLIRGVGMGLLNVLVFVVVWSNLTSYTTESGLFYTAMRITAVIGVYIGVMTQFYLYPLMMELKQPALLSAAQNALVMLWLNPLFSIGLFLTLIPVFLISTYFIVLWMLVAAGIFVSVSNAAAHHRLVVAGLRQPFVLPTDMPESNEVDVT